MSTDSFSSFLSLGYAPRRIISRQAEADLHFQEINLKIYLRIEV